MSKKMKISTLCLAAALCCALLCGCVASIRFENGRIPEDSEEISLVLSEGESEKLSGLAGLKKADFSGSLCYEEIIAWGEANPEVELIYTVDFPGGAQASNSDESLDLSSLSSEGVDETISLLAYLPSLKEVTLSDELPGGDVQKLIKAFPELEFDYSFKLCGKKTSLDAKSLDLSSLGHRDAQEAAVWLSGMKQLKSVKLGEDSRADALSWDDVYALTQAAPQADFDYKFVIFDKEFYLSDSSMDLNHIPMDDEGALVKSVTRCMPKLTYLDMDFCGVSDESMAEIRDSLPNAEVVWRIWFGDKYSVRTDVEMILASNPPMGGDLTRENTMSLQYCSKVKYLDLGHNITLDTIDFVSGMPELEVAILAMNCWSDASPLANCPKLEYLELQTTALNDLTPLSGLKNLRHLNICYCTAVTDISPLFELPDLERLWIGRLVPVSPEQIAKMQEIAPQCEIDTGALDPTSGNWRYMGKDALGFTIVAPRYALLQEQFNYAARPYSYYFNDPLY